MSRGERSLGNKVNKEKGKTMAHINETITINENEGLQIDFSRIEFVGEDDGRPSWLATHFSASELEKALGGFTFTEDSLEGYLKTWLEYTFNCGVKSFRWVWDKYRNFKAA